MNREDKIWESIINKCINSNKTDEKISVDKINDTNLYLNRNHFIKSKYYKELLLKAMVNPTGEWKNSFNEDEYNIIVNEADNFKEVYSK